MAGLEALRIAIWREGLVAFERMALMRAPVWHGDGIPRGDGAPVMLIPGFMAGDASLGLMAQWLRRIGYRPCRAGIRANVDCAARAIERLELQLEYHASRHGRRVAMIGHSRGGTLARVLAVRRPDLVESIACLGSPLTDQLAIHPLVHAQVKAVALLGSLGAPGMFSYRCNSSCCAIVAEQLAAPFPDGPRFASVYSRRDGVVDWRACLDPAARHVEVHSTHVGMAVNASVFYVVSRLLAPSASSAAPDADVVEPGAGLAEPDAGLAAA
jgi:pimeloyl-ACP methyl ester carboxylesterase